MRVLEEREVLVEVVDDEHPALARHAQLTHLRGREPVHLEQSDDAGVEAQRGRERSSCGPVRATVDFGGDPGSGCPQART